MVKILFVILVISASITLNECAPPKPSTSKSKEGIKVNKEYLTLPKKDYSSKSMMFEAMMDNYPMNEFTLANKRQQTLRSACELKIYEMKRNLGSSFIIPGHVLLPTETNFTANDLPNLCFILLELNDGVTDDYGETATEVVTGENFWNILSITEKYPGWEFIIFYARHCTFAEANAEMNFYFLYRFRLPPSSSFFNWYFVGMGKYGIKEPMNTDHHTRDMFIDDSGCMHRHFYDEYLLKAIENINKSQYNINHANQKQAARVYGIKKPGAMIDMIPNRK